MDGRPGTAHLLLRGWSVGPLELWRHSPAYGSGVFAAPGAGCDTARNWPGFHAIRQLARALWTRGNSCDFSRDEGVGGRHWPALTHWKRVGGRWLPPASSPSGAEGRGFESRLAHAVTAWFRWW